jgi:hypothetical protein
MEARYAMAAEPVRIIKPGSEDGTADVVRWDDELCVAAHQVGDDELIALSGSGTQTPRCVAWRFTVGRPVKAGAFELMARHATDITVVTNELVGTGTGYQSVWYLAHHPVVADSQTVTVAGVPKTEGFNYWFDDWSGQIKFLPGSYPQSGQEIRCSYSYYGALPVGNAWLALYLGTANVPTSRLGVCGVRSAHMVPWSVQIVLYFDANVQDPAIEGFDLEPGNYYWLAICSNDPTQASPPSGDKWDLSPLYLRTDQSTGAGRTLVDTGLRHRPDDWQPGEYTTNDNCSPWFRVYERRTVLRGVPLLEYTAVPSSGERAVMQRIGGSHSFRQVINRAASGSSVRAVFSASGGGTTVVTEHNELPGIQGGAASERYHASAAEYGGDWNHGLRATQVDAPPLEGYRTGALTNSYATGLSLRHRTSADMAAGFAVGITLGGQDATSGDRVWGRFGMALATPDDVADFVWWTAADGGTVFTERMRLTNAGGLVVPGLYDNLRFGSGGMGQSYQTTLAHLGANVSCAGGSWKYIGDGAAVLLQLGVGQFIFYTAPSGSGGGAITWTQRFSVSASAVTASIAMNVNAVLSVALSGGGTSLWIRGNDDYQAGQWCMENTKTGATNPRKYFRIRSTGLLEVLNAAYSGWIVSLTDDGVLRAANAVYAGSPGVTSFSAGDVVAKRLIAGQDVNAYLNLGRWSASWTGFPINLVDTSGGANHPTFLDFQFASVTKATLWNTGDLNVAGKLKEGGNALIPGRTADFAFIVLCKATSRSNIPAGWQECDGSNNTPDLRSRFIRGVPAGTTGSGATGGAETVTLTESQIPAHTHSATVSTPGNHVHSYIKAPSTQAINNGTGTQITDVHRGVPTSYDTTAAGDHTHTVTIGSTGAASITRTSLHTWSCSSSVRTRVWDCGARSKGGWASGLRTWTWRNCQGWRDSWRRSRSQRGCSTAARRVKRDWPCWVRGLAFGRRRSCS